MKDEHRVSLITFKWKHPAKSLEMFELVKSLRKGHVVEVALEPSGTYGDPVRFVVIKMNVSMFRVSPKRVHDAAEVQDGVPSQHDAKAAAIMTKLHLQVSTGIEFI